MTPEVIKFFHRGDLIKVSGAHTTRSVLEWLREDVSCTGTKEGCNEGDCGACTVVIGELAGADEVGSVGGLKLKTVNACIQFLPTLHGKALFTVEDLKEINGGQLHPTQQAMVECHGSQCGFCTPGFVMSLWSVYENQRRSSANPPSRQQLADALSGNLCRCTGYKPILDAGQRMFDLPPALLNTRPIVEALQSLLSENTFDYEAPNPQAQGRYDYFYAPKTVESLAELVDANPSARVLGGCTDIGLWVNKQFRDIGDIIYLGNVSELRRIEEIDDELIIGAGASLESSWAAVAKRFESLKEIWLRFASLPIRNAGTIGGNIANGSPIGDFPPVLMALNAAVILRKGAITRRVQLSDFYLGYMQNQMESGEFIEAVVVPQSNGKFQLRGYKITKRFDSDISAVCGALAIELVDNSVKKIRIAFGGMAATVKRADATEAFIVGREWNEATVAGAKLTISQDFQPLTDMRASAAYRLVVAQNLIQRFWLETRPVDSLEPASVSVWNAMTHPALEAK